MTELPAIEPPDHRPPGHRVVPLLSDHDVAHYPEFRDFLSRAFGLEGDPFRPPGLLRIQDRFYELVFIGYSGRPFPAGVQVNALVPGLEPLDEEAADRDLWTILQWLIADVGGEWTADGLTTTGRIYRIPAAGPDAV